MALWRSRKNYQNLIRLLEILKLKILVLLIRFKNGAVGIVEGSVCVYPRNLEESLSIFGEKGTVVIKNGVIETWRFADEKEYDHVELANNSLGHTPLYKDVIAAIKEGREPLVNGEEGKKAVEIILKAIEGKIYEGNR